MTNMDRFRELAGLKEKSFKQKELKDYSLSELQSLKESLESETKGSLYATEQINDKKLRLRDVNAAIEVSTKTLTEDFKSTETSALGKEKVPNMFASDNIEQHTDNKPEMDSRLGIAQDERTAVEVPQEVMSQIDMRIKELQDSMTKYDQNTYMNQYSNKQKTIDSLEFIKDKLKDCDMEKFKEIQIYYSSLTSLFTNLFPAKLVDFIHDAMASAETEVATGSYMDGAKDKKKEGEIPNSALYKPKSDPIYPQTDGKDQKPE
jgi:hypothetical protein